MSKTDPSSVVNYTWDIYGQLSSKSSGENYIFTGKRNLNTVTESNTVKELYTYDALGRRLKVQNADTTTLNFPLGNDTSYEVKKEGTDTTVTKYISANGKYLAKTVKVNTNPEQKYFHHIDLVGSIRAITDATGAVTASYEYEPFGVTIKTTGSDQDNLGFAGKRLDTGSGLSYFGARYYDSEMGRFISKDPAQDGRNWYVYCYNNPLIYIDPNGLKVLQPKEYREEFGIEYEVFLADNIIYGNQGSLDSLDDFDFSEDMKSAIEFLRTNTSIESDYVPPEPLLTRLGVPYGKFSFSIFFGMGATVGINFTPDGIYLYGGIGVGYGVSAQYSLGTSITDSPISFTFQLTSNITPGNWGPYNAISASINAYDVLEFLNGELDFDGASFELGHGISEFGGAASFEFGVTAPLFKY